MDCKDTLLIATTNYNFVEFIDVEYDRNKKTTYMIGGFSIFGKRS